MWTPNAGCDDVSRGEWRHVYTYDFRRDCAYNHGCLSRNTATKCSKGNWREGLQINVKCSVKLLVPNPRDALGHRYTCGVEQGALYAEVPS